MKEVTQAIKIILDKMPCFEDNVKRYNDILTLVEGWSIRSDSLRSTGQSGDGSGGGEEEADEACLARRPLGSSPKIHGGLVEDLDPELKAILETKKRTTT